MRNVEHGCASILLGLLMTSFSAGDLAATDSLANKRPSLPKEEIRRLVKDLDSESFRIRVRAIAKLNEADFSIVPDLLQLLGNAKSFEQQLRIKQILLGHFSKVRKSKDAKNIAEMKKLLMKAVAKRSNPFAEEAARIIRDLDRRVIPGQLTTKDAKNKIRKGYQKVYPVKLAAGTIYTIDLVASFDTFLFLQDAAGKVITQNDDGGQGLNSRIVFVPDTTGAYQLVATSFGQKVVGSFHLIIQRERDFYGERKVFAATLTRKDPLDRFRKMCPYKVHIVAMVAGQTYQIDMVGGFDTFLRLEDPQGNNLLQDDDGGGGTNSRIRFTPTKNGDYRIVATSFSSQRIGRYSVVVQTVR